MSAFGAHFVVCRDAVPGMFDERPRFLTPRAGWTYNLMDAWEFTARGEAVKNRPHATDRVIGFIAATLLIEHPRLAALTKGLKS